MQMKKLSLLTLVLGIMSINTAMAWNRPGAMTLTLADAYYHFDSKRHINNSSLPNVALAYNFDERYAAELNIGVLNTNYHNDTRLRGVLYTLDGLYRFTPHGHFESYIIGGIGMWGLKPSINTQSQYQANVNAGIGTQFFADNMIALRLEARDLYTLSGGKNDVMVNFGVSFQFFGNGQDVGVAKV